MLDFFIIYKLISQLLENPSVSERKSELDTTLRDFFENQYRKINVTKNIIYRNEPVDFTKNYIPLTIEHNNYRTRFNDPESVFHDFPKIVVQGLAGSGKTTFLKYVYLQCIEKKYKLPVFIELRKFGPHLSFETFLTELIAPQSPKLIPALFNLGDFVFIMDGFDELDFNLSRRFLIEVDAFMDKYSQNNFIVSTRYGTDIENLQHYYTFRMLPLNANDVSVFIEELPFTKSIKQNLLEQLHSDSFTKSGLGNPLYLSLYILSVELFNQIPNGKARFYRSLLDFLFTKHDSLTKLGLVRVKMSNLEREDLEKVSGILAFKLFASNKFQFSKEEIYKDFESFKRINKLNFENESLLYDLALTINILVQDGPNYSFAHLSLQEYLAATFVAALPQEKKEEVWGRISKSGRVNVNRNFLEIYNEIDRSGLLDCYILPNLRLMLTMREDYGTYSIDDEKYKANFDKMNNHLNILEFIGIIDRAELNNTLYANENKVAKRQYINNYISYSIKRKIELKIPEVEDEIIISRGNDLDDLLSII